MESVALVGTKKRGRSAEDIIRSNFHHRAEQLEAEFMEAEDSYHAALRERGGN